MHGIGESYTDDFLSGPDDGSDGLTENGDVAEKLELVREGVEDGLASLS